VRFFFTGDEQGKVNSCLAQVSKQARTGSETPSEKEADAVGEKKQPWGGSSRESFFPFQR